jgi:uncharacterized protein with HEPN domain
MKDNFVFLLHIRDAIETIETYTMRMSHDDFLKAKLVQDGVIRQIEIIGEATKNLSTEFKEKYPDIPWKRIAGMRDKLIHQYFGVNIKKVWQTVKKDIPSLKEKIRLILNDAHNQKRVC